MQTSIEDLYSDRAKALLGESFPFPEPKVPVSYNFDQGTPAPELYPLEDLQTYIRRAVDAYGELACAYFGDAGYEEMTYGFAGLRQTLATRIARRDGRDVSKDGIMLTNGSSHGLSLLAQAYLGPGDGAVGGVAVLPVHGGLHETDGRRVGHTCRSTPRDGRRGSPQGPTRDT